MFQEDEAYQNYIIERNVLNSIDQVQETIIAREKKFNDIKYYVGYYLVVIPLNIVAAILTGGISIILYFALSFVIGLGYSFATISIINPNEKTRFLMNNSIIIQVIQGKLIKTIREQQDNNILKKNMIK
jgi:hypothetical protein